MLKNVAPWLAVLMLGCAPGGDASVTAVTAGLGSGQFLDGTAGTRAYKVYVPSSYTGAALPLVLMLHGCTQDPADFATGTRMNTLADANGFFAVYPQQTSSDNSSECWNWFQPADQARGSGEPAELVAVIDKVATTYKVDATRVYAAGMSAGGAMATILGATYPDRFAAIAAGEGLEFKAATSVIAGYNAETQGGPSPLAQGTAAYTAMGAQARVVRAFVIEGSSDGTVKPLNGDQTLSQWAQADDLASDGTDDDNIKDTADTTTPGQVSGGHAYTVTTYDDARTGQVVLQKLVVSGMSHAWSGGDSAGTYTDPMGPDASQMVWDFFALGSSTGTGSDGGAVSEDAAVSQVKDGGAPTDGAVLGSDGGTMKKVPGGCSAAGSTSPRSLPALMALLLAFAVLVGGARRNL